MKRKGEFLKIYGRIWDKYVTSYIKMNANSEEQNYYVIDGVGLKYKGSVYEPDFDEILNKEIIEL